jgi:beta-glucosidase
LTQSRFPYGAVLPALSVAFTLGALNPAARAQEASLPFQNPDLSVSARVDDLVGRMTLEEKASQMMTDARAIPRLGIPAYYWWSESLHGNANAGVATVFPQAIGLAATWDPALHFDVAAATSDENRAKYNETVRLNQPRSFQGLTFFAPNINIFRDPRWGRGQETYGEDPYLTSQFGVAFVKGLQGDDPRYLKVVATAKHYAVHSGPEPERHRFNSVVSPYDLNDTYLPAFEALVRKGHAQSVMGAYSSLYGVPCCASPLLLQTYLRDRWGFTGYVVSDCGAITDIYQSHHYAKTVEEASADAVRAGTDLACDGAYGALPAAVKQGLIRESEIDTAVKRLFTARFQLGMFDPPAKVAYARIPMSVVDSAEHKALARKAARESIVLLKNDGILPFSPKIKTIAVIGPNADSVPVLVGNYNGTPSHPVTVLAGLQRRAEAAGATVEYLQGTPLDDSKRNSLPTIPAGALRSGGKAGLKGEFFTNENLEGVPAVIRQDSQIGFDFAVAGRPEGIAAEHFSARWTGELVAPHEGEYTLGVRGDDGFRLYVDGKLVIDDWTVQPPTSRFAKVTLKAGQAVPIRLEYFQGAMGAEVTLQWQVPLASAAAPFADAVALAKRADAVVYVCGLTAQLEGEEGTNGGGDRTDLNLPGRQQQLLEALQTAGKPIVAVLMNGSSLGVTWARQHVPAIVEAWYPGGEGGDAVADVLFGDYSPAGRLPVTFYQSVDQLPPFRDYAMKGRTYRYFDGEPLYPFGFGLSYTTFRYSGIMAPQQVLAQQSVVVTATVENSGARESDEVAELYLRPAPDKRDAERRIAPDQPMPRLILGGFQRIHLAPGEKRLVTFNLAPEQLMLVDAQGNRTQKPGTWQIFVGGHQPEIGRRTPLKDILTTQLVVR